MTEKALLKEVVKEIFEEEVKPLYVDRQKHHDEHQKVVRISHSDIDFLVAARKFVEALKDTFWKTLIRGIAIFILSVVTGGIYFYIKYRGHIPPPH